MRPGNRTRTFRRALLVAAAVPVLGSSCAGGRDAGPVVEFIVSAGDSTYWVQREGREMRSRGSPMVLAHLDNRFRELYVVDDDNSFSNALFVGQTLYQRDILSGDSSEVFRDTLIAGLAEKYERANPEARRLGPDEDAGDEPAITATAEVSVIGVHGPFLSLEYHADTTGTSDDSWHMTRHVVVDLRTNKPVTLSDVLGPEDARAIVDRARALYRETLDSIRRDTRPAARRAAQSLARFRFDPTSFALTSPNGTLMIAFSAPGQGHGGEGGVLPMRPIGVRQPTWWSDARGTLPTATREREEIWERPGYSVRAIYDSNDTAARLTLTDSSGGETPIGPVSSPVHRIYWLDSPPISSDVRAALTKAFDEAALYDNAVRATTDASLFSRVTLAVRR
jgi:hypothetical protein